MDKIMDSNTLANLAQNIKHFLASDEKNCYSALYHAVKEKSRQYTLAALYDSSVRHYDIFTGNRCATMHLYLNWAYAKSPTKNRVELRRIADEIRNDFVPAENVQICPKVIRAIMEHVERRYSFCTKLFVNQRLSILLPKCSHTSYNSMCRITQLMDGTAYCSLYLFHIKKDCAASPEYVLFHELGHVLHTTLTGSYNTVPESFFEMAEPLFPGLSATYRDSAPEFFADCFAMGAMLDSPWSIHDPYLQIYAGDKRLFEQYMRGLME